jgi:type I restriction enzyme M protein
MNLAIRGIEANLGPVAADTFHRDLHPDLKADFILANPPFNMSDWGGEQLHDDPRWRYGTPPAGNANFAWMQHMINHLSLTGVMGLVLANGSMSSNTSGEGEIRKNIVEADLVDCMVSLPGQLFYGTQIPACLWFIARDKSGKSSRAGRHLRDRQAQVLFIDARKLGTMISRTQKALLDEDIIRISGTYHAWRGEGEASAYEDVPGFSKSASLDEIRQHGHVLTPGRYVGAQVGEDDGESFEEKMRRLSSALADCRADSARLDVAIATNLKELGFGA